MCFYNDDYDWCASVCEVTAATVADGCTGSCDECGAAIPAGQPCIHVHQQENDPDCWDSDEGEEFVPGETFDCDRCLDCDKLLQSIEAEELARGCRPSESRPSMPNLKADVSGLDLSDRLAYRARAVAMFPELSGEFLDRMLSIYHDEE